MIEDNNEYLTNSKISINFYMDEEGKLFFHTDSNDDRDSGHWELEDARYFGEHMAQNSPLEPHDHKFFEAFCEAYLEKRRKSFETRNV
jgi:hypothetical protein